MHRTWRPIAMAVAVLFAAAPNALGASPVPSSHDHALATANLDSPAAQLRVDLDRLLAEHAFLTIEQMRSGLSGSPEFSAAAVAVEQNSTDVAAAIGSIYGAAATDPFGEIWRSHIGYLVDYAVSLGKSDQAGQDAAKAGLADYRAKLHAFLAKANPGVALGGITDALDMHTAQLIEFIDAEAAGDHARAYGLEREAYEHMFHVGDALAKVFANRFPKRYTGLNVAYSAAGTLRVTLDRILAEHAFLAAEVMRSGVRTGADFDAAKSAIGGNSDDLETVVGAAYGDAAAASFRTLWDAHIAGYLAFIDAARTSDAAGRAQALSQVQDYANQLAAFLASANPYLDAASLAALFQEHAMHLTGQVERFAAADYPGTFDLVRTGYRHMFTAGEALAVGIATQMPRKFPTNAREPDTATEDALAEPHGTHLWLPVAAVLLIAMAAFWLTARRRRALRA